MENKELLEMVRSKAQSWLTKSYDAETRAQVQALLDNEDPTELIESFYKDLEFGTGGLRGIMGVGSNRMNIYTVGAATQGLSNYLKKEFADLDQIKVVIGHDCRNNSRKFAEISADIFSANGIKVYLFEDLRPTPEMSYTIRKLGCQSGIILTASAQEKPSIAEVVAVGPGGNVDGKDIVMNVKVGDRVLISKYAGTEVKVDGVEYSILRQSDILAVVE